jgi:hypothetical protein
MVLLLVLMNLYYIDQPYLSDPQHGEFKIQLRFGPEGEIMTYCNVGLWDRVCFGVSYGAANLIGAGDPEFYEIPGVQLRFVAVPQGYVVPRVILGFDNQGLGGYDSGDGRYDIPSKGLYVQFGKSFAYPEFEFIPSIGVNYCFEGDNHLDLFAGMDMIIGSSVALLFEYTPNFDDERDQDKGYLNIGLRFIFHDELFFEVALRDLLDNSDGLQLNRMIKLGYAQTF